MQPTTNEEEYGGCHDRSEVSNESACPHSHSPDHSWEYLCPDQKEEGKSNTHEELARDAHCYHQPRLKIW